MSHVLAHVRRFGLCALLLSAACENAADKPADSSKPPTPPTTTSTAAAPAAAIEMPDIKGPVAKVNGIEIGAEPFLKEYKATIERYQKARHAMAPALRERLKDNIVRRLVDAEIIRQQAEKLNIAVAPQEFDAEWLEHKKRYGSDAAFASFLARAGMTESDLKAQFLHNTLREKVFSKITTEIKVDSAELKDFYERNKTRYDTPEQIRASHILIRTKPNASEPEKAEAKKRAEEVLAKVKASGADFAALAQQYGEDPTNKSGGDLGWFGKGRMVKPFEDTAWSLKEGQVSGIVETQFGFHIIKKTGYKPAEKKSFKDLSAQIERSVRSKKRNETIRESLKKWRDEAKVEIFVRGDPKLTNNALRPELKGISPQLGKPVGQKPNLKLRPMPRATTQDTPASGEGSSPTPAQ